MHYSLVLLLVLLAFSHQSVSVVDCWSGAEPVDGLDDCTEAFADYTQALGNDNVARVFVFRKITRFSRRPPNSLYGQPTVDMARIGLTRSYGLPP